MSTHLNLRKYLKIFLFCLIGITAGTWGPASLLANAQPAVTVTSIAGWNAGAMVVNGRWTGQPISTPRSNAYKEMLAIESQYNGNPNYTPESVFTIYGANFGTQIGSVQFLNANLQPVTGLTITIKQWLGNQVKISAKSLYNFTSSGAGCTAWVRVSRDINPPPMSVHTIIHGAKMGVKLGDTFGLIWTLI